MQYFIYILIFAFYIHFIILLLIIYMLLHHLRMVPIMNIFYLINLSFSLVFFIILFDVINFNLIN